ncbi:hypothetical protein Nepgr_004063 [Nepenthes gracilis]|uniref:Uncharacterized protein n=1 Tax=Nepenthes gracilis TaxID=150966 RepID=A0AAD3S0R8_NEPGR|nr:hypothetical protein Nepgr_004063 [Nepenthes gracilis]
MRQNGAKWAKESKALDHCSSKPRVQKCKSCARGSAKSKAGAIPATSNALERYFVRMGAQAPLDRRLNSGHEF